jgi:hypothetical protein
VANISTTEEICRQRILQYLQRCAEKGIALPKLPQFAG